jgi:hypothetical protein
MAEMHEISSASPREGKMGQIKTACNFFVNYFTGRTARQDGRNARNLAVPNRLENRIPDRIRTIVQAFGRQI